MKDSLQVLFFTKFSKKQLKDIAFVVICTDSPKYDDPERGNLPDTSHTVAQNYDFANCIRYSFLSIASLREQKILVRLPGSRAKSHNKLLVASVALVKTVDSLINNILASACGFPCCN